MIVDTYNWEIDLILLLYAYGIKLEDPTPRWSLGESDVHTGLDVAGLINPAADIANAAMYIDEGDYGNAVLSGIGVFPLIGDGIKYLGKLGKWAIKGIGNLFSGGKKTNTIVRNSDGLVEPLGRGNTGRWKANNANEEVVMLEVRRNPTLGEELTVKMNDRKHNWLA